MEIEANFKGSNSLGYVNANNYHLKISIIKGQLWIFPDMHRHPECNSCPYDSFRAFLNNWQVF